MASVEQREAALAARWAAGEFAGRWLRTAGGEDLAVVFAGRHGGPAGPDFRDAVLTRRDGTRLYGDVEVHIRARGWLAHGHATDARYNGVVLHVVRAAEGARATPLASGGWAPVVEVCADREAPARMPPQRADPVWPCVRLAPAREPSALRNLLHAAGDARFQSHAAAFAERLSAAQCDGVAQGPPIRTPSRPAWSIVDRVLFAALAEGLAYGRERELMRRAGIWLAEGGAPDAMPRELPRPSALDATRLRGLLAWRERWGASGPWTALRSALEAGTPADAARALIAALLVPGGAVSPSRAAILAANVVLPCAAAWAGLRDESWLATCALAVYAALPGLPSNQITREMVRQLGLARQPAGARAQQGLHHIWAQHCREKRCERCPCATLVCDAERPRGTASGIYYEA
jgi:uncharacterized protein DUF2851